MARETRVSVSLTGAEHAAIKATADANGESMANMLRRLGLAAAKEAGK